MVINLDEKMVINLDGKMEINLAMRWVINLNDMVIKLAVWFVIKMATRWSDLRLKCLQGLFS